MEKRLFNIIDELAVYIAVPREAIYDWISQEKLPYIKIGRIVKFDKEDIVRFIDGKKYDGIGRELDSSKNFFVKFLCFKKYKMPVENIQGTYWSSLMLG